LFSRRKRGLLQEQQIRESQIQYPGNPWTESSRLVAPKAEHRFEDLVRGQAEKRIKSGDENGRDIDVEEFEGGEDLEEAVLNGLL
jgi:hypothetical protein